MDEIKQVPQSPVVDESQLKVLRSVARALLLIAIIGILAGVIQFFSGLSLFLRGFIPFEIFIFTSPLFLVGGLTFLFLRKGLLSQERWSYTFILNFSIFLIVLNTIELIINFLQENFEISSLISFLLPALLIYSIRKLSSTLTKERDGMPVRYVGALIGVGFLVLANLGVMFLLIGNSKF